MSTIHQSSSSAQDSASTANQNKEEERHTHRLQRDSVRRGHDDVPDAIKEIEQSISQLGVGEYDDAVILQLLEAYHDHAGQIKSRAELLAHHCERNDVVDEDVHLATSMYLKSTRAPIPSNTELERTAEEINKVPLDFGDPSRVQLPPREERGVGIDAADAKAAASRSKKGSAAQVSAATSVSQTETSATSQEADPFGMLSSLKTTQRSHPTGDSAPASATTVSSSAAGSSTSSASSATTATPAGTSSATSSSTGSSLSSLTPLTAPSLHRKPDTQGKQARSDDDVDM